MRARVQWTTGREREKSGEIEESRERDVEGVEVSRVYGGRKKHLVHLNLVQQQLAGKKI